MKQSAFFSPVGTGEGRYPPQIEYKSRALFDGFRMWAPSPVLNGIITLITGLLHG